MGEEDLGRVRAAAPGVEVVATTTPGRDLLARADAWAGHLDPDDLALAGRLRWNHLWTAGADADLSPRSLAAEDVVLTTSAGNGAVPLAEHALMLMLVLDRDLPRWLDAQRAHTWERRRHPELAGQTVGIVGMGAAGRDLALKCAAFHMRVLGLRSRPDRPADGVERMYGPGDLAAMAAECDYLVLAAPLTEETRGMVDADVLAVMRPTARVVNISRGEVVDDAALLEAVTSGRIAGAGLDAHAVEPLPEDSPWWDVPGVVVTPHNAATTPQTLARAVDIFVDNVARWAQGRPLVNVVDKRSGYAP
ncbi:D-2-hydroxyacid dehydrogenase [Phycicoccus sp. BSK3Z-2]|uniref:D-2-hydroxyacid dehydrogenase n=2 Tax=Phycicoccus avicenniae TaxID=2828860 RepID=A0A941HYZ2_9MICO|nr:D-2-hydroxyacid dehydrogenase [Phycicoccus avicenniae]